MATRAKRSGLSRLRYVEPARLRAVWIAAVNLLTAVGVTVSTDVDGRVGTAIAVVGVVLALAQGEWTRAGVYSPATYDKAGPGTSTAGGVT